MYKVAQTIDCITLCPLRARKCTKIEFYHQIRWCNSWFIEIRFPKCSNWCCILG